MKTNMKSNGSGQTGDLQKKQAYSKSANTKSAPANQKTNGSKGASSGRSQAKNAMNDGNGLRGLFEDSIKDMYWAEKALVKAIPKMAKNACSEELVKILKKHLTVTEEQVNRLEDVFDILGKTARARKCEAMEGLIKEGESIMEETEEGLVRDAGIILAGQKIEHYEIATYGTLSAFATKLGEQKIAALFEQSLNEEKDADKALTSVTETSINLGTAEGEMAQEGVKENSQKIY